MKNEETSNVRPCVCRRKLRLCSALRWDDFGSHGRRSEEQVAREKRELFIYLRRLCRELKADVSTLGMAAEYLHRLLERDISKKICLYTLTTSCLIVAADVQDERNFNKRDVINVSHAILHPGKGPLPVEQPIFWEMRKTLINIAHVIFRELKYELKCELICPYLCEYMANLRERIPQEFTEKRVADVAMAVLADTYVDPQFFMVHSPKTVALVVLSLTFTILDVSVPKYSNDEWPSALFYYNLRSSKCVRLRKHLYESLYSERTVEDEMWSIKQ